MASKRRRRSLSMYFFDVNSCLYFRNVVHAALILPFDCLLLIERDSLTQIFHALTLCQYFYVQVTDFHVSSCVGVHAAFTAEDFRLVWVNRETHFLCCFFEFTHHVLHLSFGCCEQHHIVGESQVRQAVSVLVAQVDTHSFLFFAISVPHFLMHTAAPC